MTKTLEVIKTKAVQSKTQQAFNRLIKKIEKLHRDYNEIQNILDRSLDYHQTIVLPAQNRATLLLIDCVKLMYKQYKSSSRLSKKELKILKDLIIDKSESILTVTIFKKANEDILTIHKELSGFDFKEAASQEFSDFKKSMENMFKDEGLDVDLSNIEANEDDFQRQFFKTMKDAIDERQEEEPKSKPKTKRMLEKEKKAKDFENLQKKGLSTIYKQLAKALHPDLEQDPVQKIEKEALMKRLTTAYEENDLYTLLSLEIEWMRSYENEGAQQRVTNEDEMKIYCAVLKDQVKSLEEGIAFMFHHPKYISITDFLTNRAHPMHLLEQELEEICEEVDSTKSIITMLQGRNAEKELSMLLKMMDS